MIRKRMSLERQITLGLIIYSVLLSVAVFAHGLLVNERAERLIWEAMLDVEMENFVARQVQDPGHRWINDGKLNFYSDDSTGNTVPTAVSGLGAGLHDNIFFDDNEWVVQIKERAGVHYVLALDIDGFEDLEWQLVKPVIASSVVMVLILAGLTYVGARLLSGPLRRVARSISELEPKRRGQQVEVDRRSSAELHVIADSLNDYLSRNDQFVEREQTFINTTSHELRTPIAVIKGAAEIALADENLSATSRLQLMRIDSTTRDVEQLVTLLLILAKAPERVHSTSERFNLDELLPAVVEDHRHLCVEKELELSLSDLPKCSVVGPEMVVRASIGNLVRNAIENSNRGVVRISLDTSAVVRIEDPGHGMTPEEISAIYARVARGLSSKGGGIGLALIGRLCKHLGWKLSFDRVEDRGTVAILDLSSMQKS